MKKNNIRTMAVTLALLQALTLGGCKNTTVDKSDAKTDYAIELNEEKDGSESTFQINNEKLGMDYYIDIDSGKYYKLVSTRVNPIFTTTPDGKKTYSAPDGCILIQGLPGGVICVYRRYVEITEEEYLADLQRGIVIDSQFEYDDDGVLHETVEFAPVVTTVNIPVPSGKSAESTTYIQRTIYSAPKR